MGRKREDKKTLNLTIKMLLMMKMVKMKRVSDYLSTMSFDLRISSRCHL